MTGRRRRDVLLFSHVARRRSSHPVSVLVDRRFDTLDTTTVVCLSSARRRFGAVAQSAGASPRAHASTSVANSASRSSEADVLRAFASPRGATRGVVRRVRVTRGGEHAQRAAGHRDGACATAPTRVTYPSAGRGSNPARRRRANAPSRTIVARNPKTRSAPQTPRIASRDRRRRVSTRRTVDGAAIPDPSPSTGSWR